MKRGLLLLFLLAPIANADVYKSVNSAGEVIFSDVPSQGAERVRLPALSTYKSAPVPALNTGTSQAVGQEVANFYTSFSVGSPQDQSTVWDNEGNVGMTVALEPALQVDIGHKIQFYLDGKPYGKSELSMSASFHGLERGSHTLSASVLDADGNPLISTEPVTLHLHKASILHPTNPQFTPP
jgi:hypothetical protein